MNIVKKQKINKEDLYYPSAIDWMWDYCFYLGPFTDSSGDKFDLGILLDNGIGGQSAAIVYGDEPGNYISGDLDVFGSSSEIYQETIRRAKEAGVWKVKINDKFKK